MSSDLTIRNSGLSYSNSELKVVASDEAAKSNDASQEASSALNTLLNTTKQLRTQELQGEKISIGEEQLIKAIERANKALQGVTTTFEFSIHEKTKEIMVKVLDKDTGKVIRELPPEKTLDMVAKLWEMAGILVDERR